MSWAAERQTSRAEDRAYSILGLFGIVMPLHYGEGEVNAFKRLQQEIIKTSADQSIFAWQWPDGKYPFPSGHRFESQMPFLAMTPDCFRSRGYIVAGDAAKHSAYSISNIALEIEATIIRYKVSGRKGLLGWKTLQILNGENKLLKTIGKSNSPESWIRDLGIVGGEFEIEEGDKRLNFHMREYDYSDLFDDDESSMHPASIPLVKFRLPSGFHARNVHDLKISDNLECFKTLEATLMKAGDAHQQLKVSKVSDRFSHLTWNFEMRKAKDIWSDYWEVVFEPQRTWLVLSETMHIAAVSHRLPS